MNARGDFPTVRLKAVLNALADWKPTANATSETEVFGWRKPWRATAMRQWERYLMGPSPTLC